MEDNQELTEEDGIFNGQKKIRLKEEVLYKGMLVKVVGFSKGKVLLNVNGKNICTTPEKVGCVE